MNFKYSVNTTRTGTSKIPLLRLRDDHRVNGEGCIKETNENSSPNLEIKAGTPKNFGFSKNLLNSTKHSGGGKTKSFNFDIKKKVLTAFNQQTEESYQRANTDKVKISSKNFGIINSYAAITTEGCVR
jgi:hypothetical protein